MVVNIVARLQGYVFVNNESRASQLKCADPSMVFYSVALSNIDEPVEKALFCVVCCDLSVAIVFVQCVGILPGYCSLLQ